MNTEIKKIVIIDIMLNVGVWTRNMAVLLFVTDISNNNPLFVSLISIMQFAPIFLFTFIGGAYADRWNSRNTMLYSFFLSSLTIFSIIVLIYFELWQAIFLITFLSAVFSQFSYPSSMKILKNNLEQDEIQKTMAFFQSLRSIYTISGPIIGTLIYQTTNIYISLSITCLTFICSFVVTLRLRKEFGKSIEKEKKIIEDIKEGLKYVKEKLILRNVIICYAMVGGAIGLIQPLPIFIMIENLAIPKESVKWLLTLNGIGSLCGGIFLIKRKKVISPYLLMSVGLIACGTMLIIIGYSTNVALTFISQFCYGLFIPAVQTTINTLVHTNTPSKLYGRVNGALMPIFTGMMILMISVSGIINTIADISVIYLISASLFFVSYLFIYKLQKNANNLKIRESDYGQLN